MKIMDTEPFIDFEGQRVVVSGATSGIGEAITLMLDRCNATVILLGRNSDKLARIRKKIRSEKHTTLMIDLNELEAINGEIRKAAREYGPIYGLCHAAGIVETRPLDAFNMATFQSMININLTAGLELAKAVCRRDVMSKEGGSVLFISSIYSNVGMPGQIGYCATKGGVVSAARAMAVELARRNIRVNCLSPGLVRTPMTDVALSKLPPEHVEQLEKSHPLGTGKPEDVAMAAVFLLSPQNRWATGTNFVVDGGYSAK